MKSAQVPKLTCTRILNPAERDRSLGRSNLEGPMAQGCPPGRRAVREQVHEKCPGPKMDLHMDLEP